MISENFPHISQTLEASDSVKITGEVYVRDGCKLADHVRLEASESRLIINKETTIGTGSRVWSDAKRTTIGANVVIGSHCDISGTVGDNSVIEDRVTIKSTATIGSNCVIKEGEIVEDIDLPDGSTFENGKIL